MKIIETRSDYYRLYEAKVKKNEILDVTTDFPFTGISIKIAKELDFHNSYIVVRQRDTIYLQTDPHYESQSEKELKKSVLISTDESLTEFIFYSAQIRGAIEIHLINARSGEGFLPIHEQNDPKFPFYASADGKECSKPDAVPQEIWRAGLPDPIGEPQFHNVKHLVIHHSAGSNFNTNYQNTVRNIYLDHTQVNGWDDIGYNYVIAGDGTLFDGRDARGVHDDDNTRGAHFCMKNTNTMGVCILGTYMDTLPSDTAFSVLANLLAWKLNKENLNTTESFLHPESDPNAYYLNTICGHRDGCATLCPGNELYLQIGTVRQNVQDILDVCDPYVKAEIIKKHELFEVKLYPNPAQEYLSISLKSENSSEVEKISIFNSTGQLIHETYFKSPLSVYNIDLQDIRSGIYNVLIKTTNELVNRMIVVE